MNELLQLLSNQGPIGLIACVLGFLWWTEKAALARLQRDYFEHLAEDIEAAREIRSA